VPTEIERLYRDNRARLVRLVERELHDHHEAEDVVQTAFLHAQRALEHGTAPRNPGAWLAAIALNAGRRLRRRRLNAEPLEEYAAQETAAPTEIRAALATLPREQREAVLYRDVLGLSYGETAEQMGKSVNAVTMLLHRGRKRLRQALGVTVGGFGLWRWLRRAGMPQFTIAKGTAAVVAATGLATTGIVAARVVAPIGSEVTAAPAGRTVILRAARTRQPGGDAIARKAARRHSKPRDASPIRAGADDAAPASVSSVGSSTTDGTTAASLVPTALPSVPTTPTVPTTVAVQVTVSTPIASTTVTTPTAVTATTPLTTVTVPVP
jgi:RNA polymerase sigma-70 factor (ECF subfamily)